MEPPAPPRRRVSTRTAGALHGRGRVVVLGCAPTLLVTVDQMPDGSGIREIHLHPGGQGFWAARMAALLNAEVTLVAPLAGEPGVAIRALIEHAGVGVSAVDASAPNAVLVSSAHEGEDPSIVEMGPTPMSRHDVDALSSAFIAASLESDMAVLTGCGNDPLMDDLRFHHLAHDLHAVGRRVMADLSGAALIAALEGGLDLVKVSDEELTSSGLAASHHDDDIVRGLVELHARGAKVAVVSRAERPLLAYDGETVLELTSPSFRPVNHRGAGDSFTGAAAAALASGHDLLDALRLAVAAGATNVTRHGLGTGDAKVIAALAREIEVQPATAAA